MGAGRPHLKVKYNVEICVIMPFYQLILAYGSVTTSGELAMHVRVLKIRGLRYLPEKRT